MRANLSKNLNNKNAHNNKNNTQLRSNNGTTSGNDCTSNNVSDGESINHSTNKINVIQKKVCIIFITNSLKNKQNCKCLGFFFGNCAEVHLLGHFAY